MTRRNRTLAAAAALVTAAAVVPAASAHARLVRTQPADGAVLARAPAQVTIVFDDTVRTLHGTTVVANGNRASVVAGKPTPKGTTITIPLRKVGDGDYTARWRVLSDDGHTIQGVFAFAVGAGRSPPAAVLSAGGGLGAGNVISRWLFFAGLLVAGGVALFIPLVWRPATRAAGVAADEPSPFWALVFAGCLLAFLGASGLVPHHAATTTRFSVVIDVAGVLAIAGATLAAIAFVDRRLRWPALLAAVAILPLPSLAGHALDRGEWRPLNAAADMLHVAAASLWIGGLLALAVAVPRVSATDRPRLGRALVPRISAVALVSVGVIAVTGLIRALSELSAVSQLWTTGYGRALDVKTALLLVLVAIGWVNRSRLVPGLGEPRAPRVLRRNAVAELVLLGGVVVAVAFLTDLAPGRDVARALAKPAVRELRPISPPPAGATVLAAEAGDDALGIAILGDRRVEATVLDPDRRGVDGLAVTFARGSSSLPSEPCGAGCYSSGEPLGPGPLEVKIDRRVAGRFVIPRAAAPATPLVLRARNAYAHLRTVVIHERLASNPRNAIVTTWRLRAPNRLAYVSSTGASAIVVGAKRWDRDRRGPWVPSPQTPLGVPAPWWGPQPIDARAIGWTTVGNRRARVVTFFDPGLPAWFEIAVDPRTALPLTLQMTTGAHFMRHRYTDFNRPLRIAPPT